MRVQLECKSGLGFGCYSKSNYSRGKFQCCNSWKYQILWTSQAKYDTHLTAYDSHFYCFHSPCLQHEYIASVIHCGPTLNLMSVLACRMIVPHTVMLLYTHTHTYIYVYIGEQRVCRPHTLFGNVHPYTRGANSVPYSSTPLYIYICSERVWPADPSLFCPLYIYRAHNDAYTFAPYIYIGRKRVYHTLFDPYIVYRKRFLKSVIIYQPAR